jgi:phosphoglycerol transferase MdoB-like AlkP superfamily enzyme
MESMSAELMQRFGNKQNLTPFLDSLAQNSICFDSIYTSGIHTMNGIYSTLFAYPSLFRQHPLNIVEIPEYTGFSYTLKNQGYKTYYFTNHDEQFDNVGGFLKANHFDEIVSQKDYPSEEVLSTLGVPDHYLFEFSVKHISENYSGQKPFFAAYMTSSNHGPYIIPEGIDFHPHNAETKLKSIEYADWSLRHFIKIASKEQWFDSTIFVFIADHGLVVGEPKYDIPLSYHHTPFILYSKLFSEKKVISEIGGQIDCFPTVMGVLNILYDNNTLGVDLLKEKRKYIYFSSDDIVGCLNKEFFYIYREDNTEALYRYRTNDPYNYIKDCKTIANSMHDYTFSMLQTTQWMISNKKTGSK